MFAQPAAAVPPNIIVIVTDDHRAAGTMDISNPALDPMKKTKGWFHTGDLQVSGRDPVPGGTKFPNGIATTPLCCPARASIFTGQYIHNHGITNNRVAQNILDDRTLQEYLNRPLLNFSDGYNTGIFGKYLNNWDQRLDFKVAGSFVPPHWDKWATFEGQMFPVRVNEQGAYKTWPLYSTDYLATKAKEFIQETPTGQPFFLYVAPTAPHTPYVPEAGYADKPVPPWNEIADSPKFFEADRSDKPDWVQESLGSGNNLEETRDAQLRMLYSVDDMVDDIFKAIPAEQQDNTLAFFIGDNGFHWGEHGLGGKGTPYEDSIKVPFYMRWPSVVPQNKTDSSLVANIDIAPTVMDAIGVDPDVGEPMDGQSLIDQSPNVEASTRNRQFGDLGNQRSDGVTWNSIRTRTFNYIETDGPDQGTEPDFKEYYDLTRDPHENENLLKDDDPENDPPTYNNDPGVDSLQEQLADDKDCVGADCPPDANDTSAYPADTAITAKPDAITNTTDARFVFTSSVPGSSFQCALDTDTFTACPPGNPSWPYTVTFPNLASGQSHTLKVRADSDGAGPSPADQSHETYTWEIKSSALDTTITNKATRPAKLTNSSTARFEFAGTAGSSTFDCKLEVLDPPEPSAGFVPCGSDNSVTYSNLAPPPEPPALPRNVRYRFSVQAKGTGTAVDDTPATYEWVIDKVKPTVTHGFPHNLPKDFASGEFILDPLVTEHVREFRCSLDPPPTPGEPQPQRCGGYKELSSGTKTLTITATDIAGNTSEPYTRQFTINRTPSFASTPEEGWPQVSDEVTGSPSEVRTVIPDNDGGWYVGGNFTELCDSDGCHSRTDLAHITKQKKVDLSFAPSTNGSVRALALAGETLYVGGAFGMVNGTDQRANVAAFSTSNGNVQSWNPGADGTVNDLKLDGGFAYIVGGFSTVDGNTHRRVAEVRLDNGDATSWAASLNVGAAADELHAVEATSTSVYVGGVGTFTDGTTTRSNLAAIGRVSGTISDWNPDPKCVNEFGFICPATGTIYVRSLQLAPNGANLPDGPSLFVAGNYNRIGNPPVARKSVAEIRLSDGAVTGWSPQPVVFGSVAPSTVFDVETTDLTNGGAETRWSTVLTGNFNTTKTYYDRRHSTEVFRYGAPGGDGWPGDWNPDSDLFGERYDAAVSGDVIAVAGNFTAYGLDVVRRDLAFFRDPAPVTEITGWIGPPVTATHIQTFSYKSESESDITFECSLDDSPYQPCGSGPYGLKGYVGLETGPHKFEVRATDVRGTAGPEDLYEWTIQDYASSPDAGWPQVGEGTEIRAVIPDGDGGWYVGGDFTRLCDAGEVGNACGVHNNIAHIRSDGTVNDPWNPSIDDPGTSTPVRALALNQSTHTLYVGGSFSSVNGGAIARNRLASIDTDTGGFLGWNPNVVGGWVYSLQLGTDTIYAGGTFGTVGTEPRRRLAEIMLDSEADPTAWDPNVAIDPNLPPGTNPQVFTIALGSSKLYAGGTAIGGAGGQVGTGNLLAIDRITGNASPTWRPMPNSTVNKIALRSPDSSTLHVGGAFTSIGSPPQGRNKAAEINLPTSTNPNETGTVTAWDPQATGATHAFAFVQGTVLIGGTFQTVRSLPRVRLAQTRGSTGEPLDWSPSVDSTAFTMANQGSVLAVGGVFQNVSLAPRRLLAFYGPPD